jgi:IclR-like helix-turn-helix domain-containing protein
MNIESEGKAADPRVSITLSPSQVEEIVRAVEPGRAPGFTATIMDVLNHGGDADMPGYADRRLSRSLLRGLAVLACFGPEDETLGLMEIAERLGLNGSTIHRYVITLVAVGLLEQSPETRKYSLPRAQG